MPVKLREKDGRLSNDKPISFPLMKVDRCDTITHALIAWNGGHLFMEINPPLPIRTGLQMSFGPSELIGGD
jgi:hypothetical protein